MPDLVITVDNYQVNRMLTKLELALSAPALAGFLGTTIDPWIRERAQLRFQNEGDDAVGSWAPLATTTQEIRASLGYGAAHPINKRTGELEEYITGSPHRIEMHSLGASLFMPGAPPGKGELLDKVMTAQMGNKLGKAGTPPRPVIGLSEKDLAFTLTALERYIIGAVNV